MQLRLTLRLFSAFALIACTTSLNAGAQDLEIDFSEAFQGISFQSPLGIRFADGDSSTVYIAEHTGVVKVMENDPDANDVGIFLDISDRITGQPGGEFYSIEFHPNYLENGYFYVRYKLLNPHRTILSRFQRSADDPLRADPESEVILLEIETPNNENNHHGGDLDFGPDGYLYVPTGDGGMHLDPLWNAQNPHGLLGKVLRIDVDNPAEGLNYGIPPDNPFVGNDLDWREEIYAMGFRNPWRLGIDQETGDVWVGDVGEVTWEEINLVRPGENYGWPLMEGPECLGGGDECDMSRFTLPVRAYPRDEGICVIGGYVYRGKAIPSLVGKYIYTDFTMRHLWALSVDEEGTVHNERIGEIPFNMAAFGVDPEGEILVADFFNGNVLRVNQAVSESDESEEIVRSALLSVPYPNPATDNVSIRFSSDEHGEARIVLYDMLGREVDTIFRGSVLAGEVREFAVDVSKLSSGTYLYVLRTAEGMLAQKLVVAH